MQYTIFTILAPVTAAISIVILTYAWRHRATPLAATLFWQVLTTLGWLVFNTLELTSGSASATLLWAQITYIFISGAPLAWLAFALQYTDRYRWLRPARFVPLGIIPAITLVVALSNPLHSLLWRNYRFVPVNSFLYMQIVEYGPWFGVHIVYAYGSVLVGALWNR